MSGKSAGHDAVWELCKAGSFVVCTRPAMCHLNGAQEHPEWQGVGCTADKYFEQ